MQLMNLSEIKPYENNPRIKSKEAIKAVAESIKEFGFKQPIVVDKNNIIIVGHTRYEAAKKLKLDEVPVIVADELNEEQVKAYRLADNKTNELTDWDYDLLNIELDDIFNIDMEALGFIPADEVTDDIILDNIKEDTAPAYDAESSICKYGDLWKLGNHYLLCGDSTNSEHIEQLLQGNKADLLQTDPPYNVNYESADGKKIKNDNLVKSDFEEFLYTAFSIASDNMNDGAPFYIWSPSNNLEFLNAVYRSNLLYKQTLVWVKNHFTLGRQDYQYQHEECLYGWNDGAAHKWYGGRCKSSVNEEAPADYKKMTKKELIDYIEKVMNDIKDVKKDVFYADKPLVNKEHPTMKPIKIIAKQISNSTLQGDIVLDIFAGSGTTLIASEELKRNCYCVELDEHYCDVIIKRWQEYTGNTAELIKNIE